MKKPNKGNLTNSRGMFIDAAFSVYAHGAADALCDSIFYVVSLCSAQEIEVLSNRLGRLAHELERQDNE